MIRFATILLFFGVSLSLFGQQALSDNINGQWCIYSDGERINLEPSIHELGNFDEVGLTFFMRYNQYGIINEKGEVVLKEEYGSIKQLGGGYYLLLDQDKQQVLADWREGNIQLREVQKAEKLQDNWYTAEFDSSLLLINLPGQKEWELSSNDAVLESDFRHVYCEIDTNQFLFDPSGNEIENLERNPSFGNSYLLIYTPESKKIIYRNNQIELPSDASYIRIREKEILYKQKGKSRIISSRNGELIIELPYEDVSYYNDNLLNIRKNGKVGLAKKTGELIIPINYVSISVVGGLYYVRKKSGAGILDKNGKQILPCNYFYVLAYSDFFKVHNDLNFVGLISRKTGKTILPMDYSSVKLNDSIVRAFSGNMLRILQLDTNHRITKDLVMSNVTSLVNTRPSDDAGVDERLYPLGWFLKNVQQYDSLGFSKGEVSRWGLKGANDSILIRARHKQPIYVEQADFSLIATPTKKLNLPGFGQRTYLQFQVTSHITGKRLIPESVFNIDTLDLLSRAYTRFVSEKGFGVLLGDNSILRVNYIDCEDTRYVRYCTSKKTEILPADGKEYDAVRFFDLDMNNESDKWERVKLEGKEWNYVRYNNAEWNFLDTNGKTVFTEPFEFVQPYSYETALVKKKGRWGVVRADSFAIPANYSNIKRSPISDTLFVVQKSSGGQRFLDTNGRLISNGMTRFFRNEESFSQVEINRSKKLINSEYSVISGDTKFQKLLGNNIFFSKKKKKYTIFNHLGDQLGTVDLRPEEVWFEQYILVKSRGKCGVLSMDNDTLIPFQYKKISQLGNYIFAEDGANNRLYNQDLNLIEKLKWKKVLIDSISNSYAVISGGKAATYSSSQRKLGKFSADDFEHFHDGSLIEFGKQLIVHTLENELTFDFEPKTLELMGGNGYLVIGSNKIGHYFDRDWKEITFDQPLNRAKVVGEGLALARSRNGTLLFGGDVNVNFAIGTRNSGTFKNGFLLMEYSKDFEFVDVNGVNQFKRTFDEAEPFSGKYATVKEKEGWTIIDGNGHFQILPGFEKIKPLSKTLFSTSAQPLFGLFDAHGTELIPIEFQELNFLRNNIIQGRKNGEIFYFDIHGKPILLN